MRKMIIVLMIFTALSTARSADAPTLPSGFSVPSQTTRPRAVEFQDEDGKPITLTYWSGKILVLNIWATWCGPCVEELPSLDRLAATLPSDRINIVAVSQDKAGASVVRPFLAKLNLLNIRAFVDPLGRLSRELGVRGMPTTVVFSEEGAVLGRLEGPAVWDSPEFVTAFQKLAGNANSDSRTGR